MPEAVATLAPAGAGRMADLIWPGRLTAAGPAALDTSHTGRTRSENLTGSILGIGPSSQNPVADVRLGVPCAKFTVDATSGVGLRFYPAMGFTFATSPQFFSPSSVVNMATRIIWAFCGSGTAPAAGADFGLEIVQPASGLGQRILTDAVNGFGFRLADANTLQFITRGPNGLITVNLVVDTTTWHVLDLRIVSASGTPTGGGAGPDATLTVRLDGQVLNLGTLNSSWAAGTNLPPVTASGGTMGWMPTLVWNPNPINNSWTYQLRFIQAPSLIATL